MTRQKNFVPAPSIYVYCIFACLTEETSPPQALLFSGLFGSLMISCAPSRSVAVHQLAARYYHLPRGVTLSPTVRGRAMGRGMGDVMGRWDGERRRDRDVGEETGSGDA